MEGAVRATGVFSTAPDPEEVVLRALDITSIPRPAMVQYVNAQVFTTRPWPSIMDWLKLNPLRLKAMVETLRQEPDANNKLRRWGRSGDFWSCWRKRIGRWVVRSSYRRNNVVSFLFLTELVTIVLRLGLSRFTNQRRGDQWTMETQRRVNHRRHQHTQHMEGCIRMLCRFLEYKHVVEGTRDSERPVWETTLTKRINKEHCEAAA